MAAAHPEPERIILEGRLHPAAIAIDLLTALRKSGLYFAILVVQILVTKVNWMAVAGTALVGAGAALFFIGPLLRYLRFRYRLTDTSLYVTSGILSRRHRRIPLEHVQDVSSEAELAHRLLGVVKLSVQTSSTAGAEAELDCLSVADAEALQRAIEAITSRHEHGAALAGTTTAESTEQRELVYQAPLGHLVLRGLTDNRAGLIVLAALTVFDRIFELQEIPAVAGVRDTAKRTIGNLISSQLVATVALVSLGVFVFGWLASAVTNAIRFHGFTVHQSRGVFYRRYGLFTRRVHALPMRRIQALRMDQTLLRRALGIATLRTDDMGSGAEDKTAEAAGVDVFIPIGPTHTLLELAPRILPGLALESFAWKRTCVTMIRRALVVGGVAALPILAV
jgi:putative membrane protein